MAIHRKFTILIEYDDNGWYVGKCLELPDLISQGITIQELRKNMIEVIKLELKYLDEKYKKLQKEIIQISN